jgi:drug/metabolite transporter (DMT)-like permease
MPLLLIVSLIWAFSFGLIKRHLGGVDPAVVSGVRVALALLVLAPFLRPRAIPARDTLRLVGVGAVQFGVMYLAYITAFETLGAYEIAVLTILTPFWVCLFDDAFGGRFTRRAYLAAAIAVAGTAVIVVTRDFNLASAKGVALVQVSNACFALGQVFYRRWRMTSAAGVRDRDVFAWLYAGALLVTLPLAAPSAAETLGTMTATQWTVLAYLGVLASGIGFFMWNVGATRVSAATLSVMNNVKVPLAVACSLLFFGESAELWRLLAGGALIALALRFARDRKAVA